MKRHLAIVIGVLFAATLISVAILLAQLAVSWWIVLSVVLLIAVFGVVFALLITTNTRVAWPVDTFGQTTDELLRNQIVLPGG
jgi:predicted membrane channel-forming protein YqfA (hemolysin III family)